VLTSSAKNKHGLSRPAVPARKFSVFVKSVFGWARNVKGWVLTGYGRPIPFGPFPQMKTYLAKKETVQPKWYLIDAEGKVLGRLAVKAANILRGRHKPTYTPHVDTGDFVIVINAAKVVLTGKKEEHTEYMSFSGYVGGERYRKLADVRVQKPEFIIKQAVKGMLPKNRLAAKMLTKLRVFPGAAHDHEAQNPVKL
jgi:large subunit ribosomal protein L13